MKYKKLLLQIAGLIITVAIVLSCSKQEQTGPDVSMLGITPSAADVSIANKIKAFKGKMEYLRNNPHYKSGETMSVDSAVWYIEAASNYTYGDAATPYGEMVIDSFDVSVPVSNGEIQLNDILIAYDEMIGGLSEKYNAIPDENKHLIMNDVSFKSEDEGTATLGITAGFGIEGEGSTSWIFNHEWYYGEQAGDCDFNILK